MATKAVDLGGSLKAQIEPGAGGTAVILSGNITEAAKFKPLLDVQGPVRIDLAGVQRINSIGVRGWLTFVQQAETAGMDLVFERCSPAMVQQMSMISNFVGTRSRVASLIAPYYCEACRNEHLQVVQVTPGVPLQVPPHIPCTKCGAQMQLDEPEDMYPNLFGR